MHILDENSVRNTNFVSWLAMRAVLVLSTRNLIIYNCKEVATSIRTIQGCGFNKIARKYSSTTRIDVVVLILERVFCQMCFPVFCIQSADSVAQTLLICNERKYREH